MSDLENFMNCLFIWLLSATFNACFSAHLCSKELLNSKKHVVLTIILFMRFIERVNLGYNANFLIGSYPFLSSQFCKDLQMNFIHKIFFEHTKEGRKEKEDER